MMKEAISRNLYSSFLVGEKKVPVNLLQYANNTIFLEEATLQNVMVIKSMMKSFELAYGLKVNFFKSSLRSEVIKFAKLLNCNILPFFSYAWEYKLLLILERKLHGSQ